MQNRTLGQPEFENEWDGSAEHIEHFFLDIAQVAFWIRSIV